MDVTLEHNADATEKFPPRFENGRRTVNELRLFFAGPNILVMHTDFVQCKFHRRVDNSESRMLGATFVDCNFESCMFGGTTYRHVRFEFCKFRRCDFGMSEFVDCQFQTCTFQECTGEHMSLSATEISPDALLAGTPAPHYNYGSSYEGEMSPEALDLEWLEIRRALAAQLLKSNSEIHHSVNSDTALVELKLAELELRVALLKAQRFQAGLIREWLRCGLSRLVLWGTNGGTSVARLMVIAATTIPLYAVFLSFSSVEFQDASCRLSSLSWSSALGQLARATSLFLAIGYTAFKGNTALETALLVLGAAVGLIWYALLAAVVIRRVYK